MAKTTQAIIAKVLNVSRETVTKALQDHPSVSVKTKEIVQKIAKQLNYNPNLVARNLVSGKSSTIGVIIPKVINTCFAQILEEVYRIASL